jgi:REP element-mobilizing transposase RayT
MGRTARQESTEAGHHVTARCVDGRLVVRRRSCFEAWLETFGSVATRLAWTVGTYCVMPNHTHVVVWTPRRTLGIGMKVVQESHARYANDRDGLRCRGHFWSERYHNVLLPDVEHVVARLRYDARNPVKHGFVATPEAWPYSAHRALIGEEPPPPWLAVDDVLALVGGREAYRAVVARDDPTLVAELVASFGVPEGVRRAVDVHAIGIRVVMAVLGCSQATAYRRLAEGRENQVTVPVLAQVTS